MTEDQLWQYEALARGGCDTAGVVFDLTREVRRLQLLLATAHECLVPPVGKGAAANGPTPAYEGPLGEAVDRTCECKAWGCTNPACKGSCGCRACRLAYNDFLSGPEE